MTLFDYINHNIDRVKLETKNGLMPCSTLHHWAVYSRYDYYLRLDNTKSNAVLYTSLDFNIAERGIYYIIKRMETEINEN